jgi:hypothetical protein
VEYRGRLFHERMLRVHQRNSRLRQPVPNLISKFDTEEWGKCKQCVMAILHSQQRYLLDCVLQRLLADLTISIVSMDGSRGYAISLFQLTASAADLLLVN